MLSRRLIRVKVFKILFGRIIAGSDSLVGAENELIASCEKTLDLYCLMLQLPIALKRVAEERIEIGLKKFQPTEEEANPNRKFVENGFVGILENDVKFFILLFNKVHNPVIKFRIHLIEKLPLTSFQSVNSATSFLAFGLYFADE